MRTFMHNTVEVEAKFQPQCSVFRNIITSITHLTQLKMFFFHYIVIMKVYYYECIFNSSKKVVSNLFLCVEIVITNNSTYKTSIYKFYLSFFFLFFLIFSSYLAACSCTAAVRCCTSFNERILRKVMILLFENFRAIQQI